MFDNCAIVFPSSINLLRGDGKNRAALAAGKIDSNQETRDRGGKRSTLIRERQVGLRTATSSRPLLLLNISAMGRDRGVVAWRGHQGNGPPPPLLFITLQSGRERKRERERGETVLHLWSWPSSYRFLSRSRSHSPSASLHIIHTTKFELYIR